MMHKTIIDTALERLELNRQLISKCIIYTFVWGILAHCYMFFSTSFTHDSLNELILLKSHKLGLGRFFVPVYDYIVQSPIALPWVIGISGLLWISISVIIVVKLFAIQSKAALIMTSGVMVTNMCVISNVATYLQDFGCNMFALMCACISFYLYATYRKRGWLWGILCLVVSLGIYQAYLNVVITLFVIWEIHNIKTKSSDTPYRDLWTDFYKFCSMILAAIVVYLLFVYLSSKLTGVAIVTGKTNSMDPKIHSLSHAIHTVYHTYINSCSFMINPPQILYGTKINIVLHCLILCFILYAIKDMRHSANSLCCTVCLLLIVPLAMELITIAAGRSHHVMKYAACFFYLLPVILTCNHPKKYRILLTFALSLILWNNVVYSNTVYLKKRLEVISTVSLYSRVLERIESTQGYVPGETPVLFIGKTPPPDHYIHGFERYSRLIGCDATNAIYVANVNNYYAFFRYYLNADIRFMPSPPIDELDADEDIRNMKPWPAPDCIKLKNNIMMVKLSEEMISFDLKYFTAPR